MPKPHKSSVVASVCVLLGLGVCLFYVLYYRQGQSTAVVICTCMVCGYVWTDVITKVRIMVE